MTSSTPEWLRESKGWQPAVAWSVTMEAPLAASALARETGATLAADASGGMYLISRRGKLTSVTRGFSEVRGLAWSDTGEYGAAIVGESRVVCFDDRLRALWTADFDDPVLAVATSPYGGHIAITLANALNFVFDRNQTRVGRFESVRPLSLVRFVATSRALIAAADYGLLCSYQIDGDLLWDEKVWSNVGDLSISGDGKTVFLARFGHGIQQFDGDGDPEGSYAVEGTPQRVSVSFYGKRLAASTLERHLYWLDRGGELLWGALLPDEIGSIHTEALGNWLICGLDSGRIMRLDWGE